MIFDPHFSSFFTGDKPAISTDTRAIQPGDLFIPIVGANFDGHDYILSALEAGAIRAISQRPIEELKAKFPKLSNYEDSITLVSSTLDTYQSLANYYRNLINPLVIAITGSSGKTTTKELLNLVLSSKFITHASSANFNNEIGVPKTILEMPRNTEVLIVEMGMRGLGQINVLSAIAEPNLCIITNIGVAHIEILGSSEAIRKAKLEIINHRKAYKGNLQLALPETLYADTNLYQEIKTKIKNLKEFDYQPRYKIKGLVSKGIIADINAVALVAKDLGMDESQIQKAFDSYSPGKGRGEFITDSQGLLWIDDTYNANPDSIRVQVDAFIEQFAGKYKIAVIGDILESHPELIEGVFKHIRSLEDSDFVLIDARAKEIEQIQKEIQNKIKNPKESVILLKASRGAKLERLLS